MVSQAIDTEKTSMFRVILILNYRQSCAFWI